MINISIGVYPQNHAFEVKSFDFKPEGLKGTSNDQQENRGLQTVREFNLTKLNETGNTSLVT